MACETCRDDWEAQLGDKRAQTFDNAHPECECEQINVSELGPPIGNDDLLARILVSPQDWNGDDSTLIWVRLRAVWRAGLSFFRPGVKPEEVRERVETLTLAGPEEQKLVGAILTTGGLIRAVLADPVRTYCVYDTDAAEFSAHADALGRWSVIPAGASRNKTDGITEKASKALRVELERKIVRGGTADELIAALKAEGFSFAD